MKRFAYLLAACTLALFVTACDDTEGDYPRRYSFVTEHTIEGQAADYYFTHDNGQRFYPADRSRIPGFRAHEGRRAIIYYNFLKETSPGYDHDIALYEVAHPRIGASIDASDPDAPEFSDDASTELILDNLTTSRQWLNLGIGYHAQDTDHHAFSLVMDEAADDADDGWLALTLYHSTEERTGWDTTEFICFRLDPFAAALEGKQGIALRMRTFGGERVYRIELPR